MQFNLLVENPLESLKTPMDGYRITITEGKMGAESDHSDRILHINSTALSVLVDYC